MPYESSPEYTHAAGGKLGVLLVNSGTPDSLALRDVRSFLKGLLGDPRTIELPRLLWLPILYGAILPFRPARSAVKYRKVWTPEGSPLLVFSKALRTSLVAELAQRGADVPVELGMLYSSPSVRTGLCNLRAAGAQRILVLPLFPQYSGTTNAAAFDQVAAVLRGWRWLPELIYVPSYFQQPGYIEALAATVREHEAAHGSIEHLLFSFHGIPARYVTQGDPYRVQCELTASALAAQLGLPADRWTLSFQSRVGAERWLEPYTDTTVDALAQRGVRQLTAMCPGFAVDCLETLEEVALDYGGRFRKAGGEALHYIPALNARPDHVRCLADAIAASARLGS